MTDNDKLSLIYKLSKFQFQQLQDTANGDCVSFGVMGAAESDPDEDKAKYATQIAEMDALVAQGLLSNVTPMFPGLIEEYRDEHGRELRVYALTDTSLKLFSGAVTRKVQ